MRSTRGIYLHLPFCLAICPYCDFAKEPWRASREVRYLSALRREIEHAPAMTAGTLFIGGGTPNLTPVAELCSLIACIREKFALPDDAEISVECNPERIRPDELTAYRAAGVTRLSLGVQSFVPAELAVLGRAHTPEHVREFVVTARAAGFENISLDGIFAIPGQTLETLDISLDAALALEVPHISWYGLTIEEGTPYATMQASRPEYFIPHDLEAACYDRIIERLEAAGYEHYEVSNFARPGYRCAHNANYWDNGEYLGFGVGAASYYRGERRTNTRELDAYCTANENGAEIPAERENLDDDARIGESMMLGLRRAEGIDYSSFQARYAVDVRTRYRATIDTYLEYGLLEEEPARLRLTPRGRRLANLVCEAFIVLPEAA